MLDFVPVRFLGSTNRTTFGLGESHATRGVTET
jgi:hypothetical protein